MNANLKSHLFIYLFLCVYFLWVDSFKTLTNRNINCAYAQAHAKGFHKLNNICKERWDNEKWFEEDLIIISEEGVIGMAFQKDQLHPSLCVHTYYYVSLCMSAVLKPTI